MSKGGAREGSGRKPGCGQYGESTVPIRIPKSLIPKIKKILQDFKKSKNNLN